MLLLFHEILLIIIKGGLAMQLFENLCKLFIIFNLLV